MRIVLYFLLIVSGIVSNFSHGADDSSKEFRVEDIQIQGLQRMPASRVFAAIAIDQGDMVGASQASKIVRDVFSPRIF